MEFEDWWQEQLESDTYFEYFSTEWGRKNVWDYVNAGPKDTDGANRNKALAKIVWEAAIASATQTVSV